MCNITTFSYKTISGITALIMGAVILICFCSFLIMDHLAPLPLNNRPVSALVTASDGTPLRAFSDQRGIWRYPASVDQVSPLYMEALLTYEDRWFYRHPGVNPLSILRATIQNIRAGRIISGGSTLTMQVARMISTPAPTDPAEPSGPVNRADLTESAALAKSADPGKSPVPNKSADPAKSADKADKATQAKGKRGKSPNWMEALAQADRRTLKGKAFQVFRALQLEWHLTKDEILNLYLTHAPFGSNIEGVRTASYTWLGKDASELSHAEAALLAVLPQAPSFYRPDRHPRRARRARDKVLERMESQGVWSHNDVTAAKQEPVIALRFHPPLIAPIAARRLHFQDPANPLIRTTLDFDLQVHIQEMVKNYVAALVPPSSLGRSHASPSFSSPSSQSPDPASPSNAGPCMSSQSGAALVVNHKTLEVKAYVGSADFASRSGRGHVDMIQALRSPGSTLKPFLYGAAMDEGLIHSHSLLLDTPRFKVAYEPHNFTGGFMGPVSVAGALRNSLNVPAVQVLKAYGPHRFHDRLKHAGASFKFQGKPNLSMILGGVGSNLESLVTLYTALVRKGLAGRPRLKKDDPVSERYLLSPGSAWIVTQILSQPMPGYEGIHKLAGHVPVAWKTGTSYGFRDAWAMGIMGDYVVGVWVGRPDGTPVPGQYGAVTAVPLLKGILQALPLSNFQQKMPQSVQKRTICWPLGGYPPNRQHAGKTDKQPENCMKKHGAWILDGKTPPTLTLGHMKHSSLLKTFWVNSRNQRAQPSCGGMEKISVALWPASVEPWLPLQWRRSKRIPPASDQCPDLAPFPGTILQITSVSNESILSRPPGQTTASIPLTTIGGEGTVHWFLNREPIAVMKNRGALNLPMPMPGSYQLVAADEAGNSDMIFFSVISPDKSLN